MHPIQASGSRGIRSASTSCPVGHYSEANAEFLRLYALTPEDAGYGPAEFAERYADLPAKQAAFDVGADYDLVRVDLRW